jgi:hypothetical protein
MTDSIFRDAEAAASASNNSIGYASMDKIVETGVQARGGRLGRPVLGVLIASTLLTVAALTAIYVIYFAR